MSIAKLLCINNSTYSHRVYHSTPMIVLPTNTIVLTTAHVSLIIAKKKKFQHKALNIFFCICIEMNFLKFQNPKRRALGVMMCEAKI